MSTATIPSSLLKFVKELSANNDRTWFAENKPRYQAEQQHMIAFADDLIAEMNKHDKICLLYTSTSTFN